MRDFVIPILGLIICLYASHYVYIHKKRGLSAFFGFGGICWTYVFVSNLIEVM